jgi:hypothetical protein
LVLVAAAVVAIALVPMVAAYLQLGYHADVEATGEHRHPAEDAERVLDRAVHNASVAATGEYDWSQRDQAIDEINDTLAPFVAQVEESRVESGVVYRVDRNVSAATTWAAANCPAGPNREFGPCEARGGVVVQERAGETQPLAVALDLRVTTDETTARLTFVFGGVGG